MIIECSSCAFFRSSGFIIKSRALAAMTFEAKISALWPMLIPV